MRRERERKRKHQHDVEGWYIHCTGLLGLEGGGWVQALEQCEESVTRSTKEFRAMDGGQVSVGSGPHLGHTRGSYWMVIG